MSGVKALIAKAQADAAGKPASTSAAATTKPTPALPPAPAAKQAPAPTAAAAKPAVAAAPAKETKTAPAAVAAAATPAVAARASVSAAPVAATRPRGGSDAGKSNAADANALSDGLTFVEKDSIQSVARLVEVLQTKDAVDQKSFRRVLGLVCTYLESGTLPEEKIKATLATDATYSALFNGLHDLLNSAVRTRVKDKDLVTDLNKIGLPSIYANDLLSAYNTKRDSLSASAASKRIALPGISDLSWRVDVAVSTTALSRVFKPTIIMQVTLTDNTIKTFECSVEKFHELRYNVAKLLKAMQDLEVHPTLQRADG